MPIPGIGNRIRLLSFNDSTGGQPVAQGTIGGVERWLFAIPDQDPNHTGKSVMLSGEYTLPPLDPMEEPQGRLYATRIDPLDITTWPQDISSWTELSLPQNIINNGVADHWHVFIASAGVHWISYALRYPSGAAGQDALILCLGMMNCENTPSFTYQEIIASSNAIGNASIVGKMLQNIMPTNDHFIVEIKNTTYTPPSLFQRSQFKNGIFLGLWDHNGNIVIIPIVHNSTNSEFSIKTSECIDFDIGQTQSNISLSNGGSANNLPIRYEPYSIFIITPNNMNPDFNTYIYCFEAAGDGTLNPSPVLPPQNTNGSILPHPRMTNANYAMPTLVSLPDGVFIITYRVFPAGTGIGPQHTADEDARGDYGGIERVITDGVLWSTPETIVAFDAANPTTGANRPHTSTIEIDGVLYLLTTWDQIDRSTWPNRFSCQLRVDEVTLL